MHRLVRRSLLAFAVAALCATGAAPAHAAGGDVVVEALGNRGLSITGDNAANDLVIDVDPFDGNTWILQGRNGTLLQPGRVAVTATTISAARR